MGQWRISTRFRESKKNVRVARTEKQICIITKRPADETAGGSIIVTIFHGRFLTGNQAWSLRGPRDKFAFFAESGCLSLSCIYFFSLVCLLAEPFDDSFAGKKNCAKIAQYVVRFNF